MNDSYGAHVEQVRGLWIINAGFTLRYDYDGLVFAQRVDELDGTLPAHRQGENRMREKDGVPYR
jgi:hypothetical protein